MKKVSRRDVIKTLAVAPFVPQPPAAITIAGQPIEILTAPASGITTRISVVPRGSRDVYKAGGDGSLLERSWTPKTLAVARPAQDGPLQIRVNDRRFAIDTKTGALTFTVGSGPLLGLGEGGPQFDRRGSTLTARSGQGGYQLRTHGGRVPVQWLIDTEKGALFIHQPYGTFTLTGAVPAAGAPEVNEAHFDPGGKPIPLDFFVVASRDPEEIMKEYAQLTGFPAMPPLWSFGYQQSHRTLASREEILEEAKTFREKKLPCETMIYLGTGFCPSGWNTDNGEFAFNPKVFPDPKKIIDELHDDHLKVVLHIVVEARSMTGTVADRCSAAPLPSGRTADGTWPDDRQVSCYWPAHKPLFDLGVDGWWPDQGDGLDPASRLARNRMYWDGSRLYRPDQRPFALNRNGCPGMQRYGSFLWSGDVYSTWETLKTHVPVAINTALSGIPYWGTDIGGFVPTKEFTGELYVRWFQFGAFCPLFRSHGRTWKLRLPWGWNTGELGPDEVATYTGGAANPDASELHNAAVEPICRKYLELRSQLMPYLYSAVREGRDTGLPIIRALWLHYPDDERAVARGDQYLWGRDVLVAPVVEKGATSRRLYLPPGAWFDFWTNERHEGGREIDRAVTLETMPLFVRAGAILPLGPVKQYTSEPSTEPLTLQVHPGADGAFTLYEDDGVSYAHERGDWMRILMQWSDGQRQLTLKLADNSRMRPPAQRPIRVRIAGTETVREIVFDGKPIQVKL